MGKESELGLSLSYESPGWELRVVKKEEEAYLKSKSTMYW